jgi:hypothetical protein
VKAHVYNPSYSEGRDQENHGLRLVRAKSLWDPTSAYEWCTPVITATRRSRKRRIVVHANQGIKWDPISKIANSKGQWSGSSGTKTQLWNFVSMDWSGQVFLDLTLKANDVPTGKKKIYIGLYPDICSSEDINKKVKNSPQSGRDYL